MEFGCRDRAAAEDSCEEYHLKLVIFDNEREADVWV